jgi:class 3 adenylate cyclase
VTTTASSEFPWYRSFRVKLIVTLFPILAGVTIASLWFAERLYSKAQQRQFEAQFESYIQAFDQTRQARFEAISEKLAAAASDPTLIHRLQTGELQNLRSLVEPLLQDLAPPRPSPDALPERRPFTPRTSLPNPDPTTARPLNRPLTYIALLDQDGQLIEDANLGTAPRSTAPLPSRAERQRRARAFLRLKGQETLALALTQPHVGYKLITLPGSDRSQVAQIFVNPIRSSAKGDFLGALIFGLPLPALDEVSLYAQSWHLDQSRIMSGVWAEDQVISSTIPSSKLDEVATIISQEIKRSNATEEHLIVHIDGIRYRIIYRILNPDSPFEHAAQVNLYSLNAIDGEIMELRTIAAQIAGVAMLVSLGLILFVSRGLSGPVSALTAGTRSIVAGRYDLRLPVTTLDELGQLTAAFNDMAANLALKDRYRAVLDAVADPSVAQRLLHESHDLGGIQKVVTILFCDIRGFTALSERLDPTEVIDLINEHMTALTDIAYQHGGTVDKFVGDLIMVLFGAPESSGQDPAQAVACAIAMQHTRAALNAHSHVPLEIGIGIATGQVIVGCMGSKKRLNYTVLGHRVNLAARLCNAAGPGDILVDDNTRDSLPSSIALTPQQPVRLKGISAEIQSYAVNSTATST